MDANTVELLMECNKGTKMAISSISQLLEKINGTDFCKLVKAYYEKHKELQRQTAELLQEYGMKEAQILPVTAAFSYISTEMKTMVYDDKKIAGILMDGCNMGIKSVSEYLNKYTDADVRSVELARSLVRIEEHFMSDVKEYL